MPERTLFPIGTQPLQIAWCESGTSSKKGTPNVAFKLSDGSQSIYNRCYLTDAAMWQIENMAKSVGVSPSKAVRAAKAANDPELINLFKGKTVLAMVVSDEYTNKDGITKEGREVKRIDIANPAGAGEHLATMSAFGFSRSRNKGTLSLDVCFTTSDGKLFWANRWITERTMWQVTELAVAVGADQDKAAAAAKAEDLKTIESLLAGKKIKIILKDEDVDLDDGRTITNTSLVGTDSLDADIRDYMRKVREARLQGGRLDAMPPAPKNADSIGGSANPNEDDIPF